MGNSSELWSSAEHLMAGKVSPLLSRFESRLCSYVCVWEELGNLGQHVFNTQKGKVSQSAKITTHMSLNEKVPF